MRTIFWFFAIAKTSFSGTFSAEAGDEWQTCYRQNLLSLVFADAKALADLRRGDGLNVAYRIVLVNRLCIDINNGQIACAAR